MRQTMPHDGQGAGNVDGRNVDAMPRPRRIDAMAARIDNAA